MITAMTEVSRERLPLTRLDKAIYDSFSTLTRERFGYRVPLWGMHKLRGIYSIKDLAWSVKYHVTNWVQPEMYGSSALMREYSRIGKGNPAQAIAFAEYQMLNPNLTTKRALSWAAKHKITSPRLMEEIDFLYGRENILGSAIKETAKDVLVTGRRMGELNEAAGRVRTFLMGLEFYRSVGMTEIQALKAAG